MTQNQVLSLCTSGKSSLLNLRKKNKHKKTPQPTIWTKERKLQCWRDLPDHKAQLPINTGKASI